MADPVSLKLYLAAGHILRPLVDRHLVRRVVRGKEDPTRVSEKRGIASLPRPDRPIIWCHAVGVGEAVSLIGFATLLSEAQANCSILVTTSSRNAAAVLDKQNDGSFIHQFLPVDVPPYVSRFLDYWQPSLAIWAERDVWPRLLKETHDRGIPQAIVNGRMTEESFRQKLRLRRFFGACYERLAFISAQDVASEERFARLAPMTNVTADLSLKSYGPPLIDHPDERANWASFFDGGSPWLAASIHPEEFDAVLETHSQIKPNWVLIAAPRNPKDAPVLERAICARGWSSRRTSDGPGVKADILIEDRLGYLGVWYRLAHWAFIGGSWDRTGGHNPYEPARLGCPFFHGPNVSNFVSDYAGFAELGFSLEVQNADDLASCIQSTDLQHIGKAVQDFADHGETQLRALAERCVSLIRT
ncbi:MAG: glycosyltransferase N-terminal domain-containing protein [Pseudomonadota bacterium]